MTFHINFEIDAELFTCTNSWGVGEREGEGGVDGCNGPIKKKTDR